MQSRTRSFLHIPVEHQEEPQTHHFWTMAPVRHPSYTGVWLSLLGVTCSLLVPGSWIAECSGSFDNPVGRALHSFVTFVVVVGTSLLFLQFRRIRREDEMLRQTFGEEWEARRVRVPYKLIPGVY
jgi:protein-S-isoprenylcysteine O-methyltransferase Ste14